MHYLKNGIKKNDPVLIENYKKYSNKLTSIKRIAKQNFYAHMIQLNKNDLSKQWQLINQILERNNKHKASLAKLINEKNESLTRNVEICNNLNSYFINIGPKMASKYLKLKHQTVFHRPQIPFSVSLAQKVKSFEK